MARRFVPLLSIAFIVVFTTCSQTPTSAASQDDLEILAKPGGGQGGKVKTVTAAELGLEIVVGGSSGQFSSITAGLDCPEGKTVIGGGFKEDVADTPNFVLTAAYPVNPSSGQSGYRVRARSSDQNQIPGITLYAVCINE